MKLADKIKVLEDFAEELKLCTTLMWRPHIASVLATTIFRVKKGGPVNSSEEKDKKS